MSNSKAARDVKVGDKINLASYGRGKFGTLEVSFKRKHRRYDGDMQIQGTVAETGQLIEIHPRCNEILEVL